MPTTLAPAEGEYASTPGTVILAHLKGEPATPAGSGGSGDGPGGHGTRSGMEERVVNGRRCTNRPGAAEYLGRSLQTINLVASPKRRTSTGWPACVDVEDGQEWYAFDDLDSFRKSYLEAKKRARQAKVHQITLDGDPDELIPAKDFRAIIGVGHGVWSKYVEKSIPAWEEDRDGYLPKPDREEPGRRGVIRSWKRHRVQTWVNNRSGSASSPGRPTRSTTPASET
jgi:hypothetical protein